MIARPIHRRESERGFAMLLVFLMAAAVALMLYRQVPRVAFESERQKEQLLIDRGEQYKRAIQLFRIANNRFPTTLEELEKYQDKRYLRHRYKDPMTGKDEWRIVHTNGMFLTDSQVTKPPNPNDPNSQLAGGNPLPGGLPSGVNGAFPNAQNPGLAQVPGQAAPGGTQEVNAAVAQRPSDRTMPGQTAGNFVNPGFGDPNQQGGFQPQQNFPQQGFPQPGQLPGGQAGVQANIPPGPSPQQPGLQQPVFPQAGQLANGQPQALGDPQQNQFQQNLFPQNQPQQNQGFPQQPNDPFNNNNNSNNPASFPPITLYPAGGNQPGAQNNNQQQFNPQFPGQLPGQQPQFPVQQPVQPQFPGQPQFNGILGQPGANPGGNQQQQANPQYRVDSTGALVPIAPGANSPQNGFSPISLPGQPGAAPGVQQNNQPFRTGGGPVPPTGQNQIRTPTAPGPVQQQGAPNQALNLINQLLKTPRQPPAGVTSGQSMGTMQTNGIAGVASTAKGPSIKRYKERGKYNEWEFVFEVQQPGAPGRPGQQGNPLGGPQGNPLGGPQGTTPTSPTTGQPNGFPSFIPQGAPPSVPPRR